MKQVTKVAWTIFVIGFLMIIYVTFIAIPRDTKFFDCIKDIAEDYCNKKNMPLIDINQISGRTIEFNCQINERERTNKKYYILEEEIESCKK